MSNIVGFKCPVINVEVPRRWIFDVILVVEVSGDLAKGIPVLVCIWKVCIPFILVKDGVPDCVKLGDVVLRRDRKRVTMVVSFWVILVNPIDGMHWLMDVTDVVDQESHHC